MTDSAREPTEKNIPKPKRGGRRRPSNDSNSDHDIADMTEAYGIMASDPIWTDSKRDRRRDGQK